MNLESYWKQLYEQAKENTLKADGFFDLIEVAAQHPLKDGMLPNEEFEARLMYAFDLAKRLEDEGQQVHFYIPGSKHRFNSKEDLISLSLAGKQYLLQHGIEKENIFSDETNAFYAVDGVYNSKDECYVASRIFHNGNYRRLHCVCSPNQIMRKKLFYIQFGVIPYYHTVNTDNMFHDDIWEFFHGVPNALNGIPDENIRNERKPSHS